MRFARLIAALVVLGSALAAAGGLAATGEYGESDYARLLRKIRAARHARRLLRRQGSTPSMPASAPQIVVRLRGAGGLADLSGLSI